ncbi:MAG: NAD-dependent epimerase/dehydratase family protein, partial [Myxococcales bacterium]
MTAALIGYTGFTGANLAAQAQFEHKYNSRNIEQIRGGAFDLVVCAGASAAKWKANNEPEEDRAAIQRLIEPLREVRAEKFVLISTVDVYPRPAEVDEDAPIDPAAATAYGRHRLELEQFCRERFAATVLRLPLLFGPGLKKNVLFDLMLDHQVQNLHPDGVFQYYGVAHLWRDIHIALERGLAL